MTTPTVHATEGRAGHRSPGPSAAGEASAEPFPDPRLPPAALPAAEREDQRGLTDDWDPFRADPSQAGDPARLPAATPPAGAAPTPPFFEPQAPATPEAALGQPADPRPQPSLQALAQAFAAGMEAAQAGPRPDADPDGTGAPPGLSTEFCTRFGRAFLQAYLGRSDAAGRLADPAPPAG